MSTTCSSRPSRLGGGTRSLPNNALVRLELIDERRFGSGVVHLHDRTRTDYLMRSDPLDVAIAITIWRGTARKEQQNLAWAVGYNAIALPIAAGVFEPSFRFMLRPEIAALSMSGSTLIVSINALLLRRLKLPVAAPAFGEVSVATMSTR